MSTIKKVTKDKKTSRNKLTDKQKKKIIADYVATGNYSETARRNNISETTVRRICKDENNKEVKEKVEQKKEENSQDMFEYMKNKDDDKKRIVDLCFEALDKKLSNLDMFTNVKDIATVYGIIMDKELKFRELELRKQEIENQKNTSVTNNGIITDLLGALKNAKENR